MQYSEASSLAQTVLRRVGYFDLLCQQEQVTVGGTCEDHVTALRSSNARLAALRQQYATHTCPAFTHTQWSDTLVDTIPLAAFRSESAFMWQLRDANVPPMYLATYYYHCLSSGADLLALCTEDGAFGAYGVDVHGRLITRDLLDSVTELTFVRECLNLNTASQLGVLDIGSGYGRLAHRISQCFPNVAVVCTDAIPLSAFLCEFYLRYRGVPSQIAMVPVPELIPKLDSRPIDLAIAVNSLTECSERAVVWWLDLLVRYDVPRLLIIPHSGFEGGRRLFTTEEPMVGGVDIAPLLVSRGYRLSLMRPKYLDPELQRYGVSPTFYHLFARSGYG